MPDKMLPDIPPRPKRGPGSKSDLTGPEIKRALDKMGVPYNYFATFTGMNKGRLGRILAGTDPEAPLFLELGLFILHNHPEYRRGDGVLALPFEEWGIDIED